MLDEGVVEIDHAASAGPFLIVCEHASNRFPDRWGTLGLGPEARTAHIAWDPGALGLARGLALRLDAPVVVAGVSRLIYDCNRPPDHAGAMAARSETYDIPGNVGLDAGSRVARTETVYLPFHSALRAQLARMLARGVRPVLVTVHSFSPSWFGSPRAVELGVIHDTDPAFAGAVAALARQMTGLRVELNQPYSAADGVTHTLKLHATPYGLAHVMLEIRNDLIAAPSEEERMADTLAPVLAGAFERMGGHRLGAA